MDPLNPELANFSFLVFMLSTSILAILLFYLVIDLAVRIFEIIILLFIAPIVISISVSDDGTRFRF